MPSTVVLLSFLFLPVLSEDLGKESCGRKVEPAKGMRGLAGAKGIILSTPKMLQDTPGSGAQQSPERHQQLPKSCTV